MLWEISHQQCVLSIQNWCLIITWSLHVLTWLINPFNVVCLKPKVLPLTLQNVHNSIVKLTSIISHQTLSVMALGAAGCTLYPSLHHIIYLHHHFNFWYSFPLHRFVSTEPANRKNTTHAYCNTVWNASYAILTQRYPPWYAQHFWKYLVIYRTAAVSTEKSLLCTQNSHSEWLKVWLINKNLLMLFPYCPFTNKMLFSYILCCFMQPFTFLSSKRMVESLWTFEMPVGALPYLTLWTT